MTVASYGSPGRHPPEGGPRGLQGTLPVGVDGCDRPRFTRAVKSERSCPSAKQPGLFSAPWSKRYLFLSTSLSAGKRDARLGTIDKARPATPS